MEILTFFEVFTLELYLIDGKLAIPRSGSAGYETKKIKTRQTRLDLNIYKKVKLFRGFGGLVHSVHLYQIRFYFLS
jgi:hypothetical protein